MLPSTGKEDQRELNFNDLISLIRPFRLHPVDWNENVQLKYLLFVNTTLLPVIVGTAYTLGFFISKPNLRAAAKRELGLS